MKKTLLIADGDAELGDFNSRFLTARGYDVETSLDGLDCLEKLRRLEPAVLVLDLELPWGGGDGVLAWLREEGLMPGIPVILTAPAGYLQDIAEGIDPPVVDYLPKPFALTALLEKVRCAVANGQRATANARHLPAMSELFIG